MNRRKKIQVCYLLVDIVSSLLVWLCFLLFRWLVYEGRVFSVEGVLIPAFDFYTPLVGYPIFCVMVYYLSGYYLKPMCKKYLPELATTLCSAIIISLVVFFVIVIDDNVENFRRYWLSLGVLMVLQFVISYVPRVLVTSHWRCCYPHRRSYTIRSVDQVDDFIRSQAQNAYDEVVIDLPQIDSDNHVYSIINRVYPIHADIAIVPRLYDMLTGAARIEEVNDIPLVRITDQKMSDCELCMKRAFDVVFALGCMVCLLPLYVVLAVVVWCSSKGPVWYAQERIGLHGIPFRILKFRTMYVDAEQGKPQLSSDEDPRITRVGHWLRKYRLDELPQMWNVLRGDMSVVGPRPERRFFISQIEQLAPYYCLLYKIRPGLTSWGPIRVGYTDTVDKMVSRLNYDIVYMENMSIGLDIKIMFNTIEVLLDGKGK